MCKCQIYFANQSVMKCFAFILLLEGMFLFNLKSILNKY